MATYRNKKTGATITTDLIISGGDWEIEEKKKKEPKKIQKVNKFVFML